MSSIDKYSTEQKKEVSYIFPLSTNEKQPKRVQVHKFKGKVLIDIREIYQQGDEWLPCKKGISLNVEQYKKFKELMPLIEEALGALGVKEEEE